MATKRAKQLAMPGTKGPVFKDLDKAAEDYVEVRNERMELTEREVEARDRLVAAMQKHSLTSYRVDADPALLVTLKDDVKVKVTKVQDAKVED